MQLCTLSAAHRLVWLAGWADRAIGALKEVESPSALRVDAPPENGRSASRVVALLSAPTPPSVLASDSIVSRGAFVSLSFLFSCSSFLDLGRDVLHVCAASQVGRSRISIACSHPANATMEWALEVVFVCRDQKVHRHVVVDLPK